MDNMEKPIPDIPKTGNVGTPARSPYDLTRDPVWKKGVATRRDVRRPDKHYKEEDDG